MLTQDVRGGSRLATVAIAALLLAACASHPKPTPPPPVAATPPPPPPAPYTPPPPPPPVETGVLPGSVQDFVIHAGDRVYFDYDKYNLRPDALTVLAAQAAWLEKYPAVQVRIEGNTDERGTEDYNFALGARRASAVKDYLDEHGVNADRITTVSYGKDRPIDPGTGEAAWAKNRNAHTDIVSGAR
jgi:peptidoglycan-associated lipoprotein